MGLRLPGNNHRARSSAPAAQHPTPHPRPPPGLVCRDRDRSMATAQLWGPPGVNEGAFL